LWVALNVPGNEKTVQYLIGKGADPKEARANGMDDLIRGAANASPQVVQLLLEKGLDPHHAVKSGDTALVEAVACDGGTKALSLIRAGADVNALIIDAGRVKNGPIELTQITPLMLAASCGESNVVEALLKAGAKVNALDVRHMTPLMMAVGTDRANPDTVNALIAAGADANIGDRNSETALDWARKYRNPSVIALLEKNGAKSKGLPESPVRPADYKPTAGQAIQNASALLAKSSETFFHEGGGCVGCHHQPFAARAFGAVKSAGLTAEPRLRQGLINGMASEASAAIDRLPLLNGGPAGYDAFLYRLVGMSDMEEAAMPVTDVMVHFIAEQQSETGAWTAAINRPPLQESSVTRTMLAIGALRTYGWPAPRAEFDERIARARVWLLTAKTWTTVDEADRLTGLWLAGAPASDLKKAAGGLMARQRTDGGWAQTPYLESDAFGTAAALYSLRKSGFLKVGDPAYQRGARYLLETQFPDGAWYVRSRAIKLQPYFQSEFPFNHDQWISNSATAYAVMALAPIAETR
jgi:ankyrin repeat protein